MFTYDCATHATNIHATFFCYHPQGMTAHLTSSLSETLCRTLHRSEMKLSPDNDAFQALLRLLEDLVLSVHYGGLEREREGGREKEGIEEEKQRENGRQAGANIPFSELFSPSKQHSLLKYELTDEGIC